MKAIINYTELSDLTKGKLKFTRISETEINVSGEVKTPLFKKNISIILKIERIGYSSVTFQVSDPLLVSIGLKFVSHESIISLGDGRIKVDLRLIPELDGVVKTLKLDSVGFEENKVIISASPRP